MLFPEISATLFYELDAMELEMNGNSCDSLHPQQTRKIKPTRRSVSGAFPFRSEVAIPFESTLERDFLIRSEFFLNVLDIIAQPVKIPFTAASGRTYTYTPDFLVYYKLGNRDYCDYPKPLLVEVKPEAEWRQNWRKWLPKWKAARRYAISQGWEFRIFDENRIRDTVLTNIRFLDRYKRLTFASSDSQAVLANVSEMGSTQIHYLLARHFMGMYRDSGIAHVWTLIATRQLDCDMAQPLNEFTEVWIPDD